tara:strand:+ start:435 stop:2162 length:1728 start_codon:yes stop_codon:yes gene_type:complete
MKKYWSLLKTKMRILSYIIILIISLQVNGQEYGSISGNLQNNYQTFQEDIKIGAEDYPRYTSGYLNLIYNYKNITIGTRLEMYHNTPPGSGLEQYEGAGIPYRFIQYKSKIVDITAGNFYDEFGNGLIFKTYFDPSLGVDNSINGLRLKFTPIQGLYITALAGKQRNAWDTNSNNFIKKTGYMSDEHNRLHGLVSAFNADLSLNEVLLKKWNTYINIGASFVTKNESDNNPVYYVPENVGAFNSRINISKGNMAINIDYATKINDPSSDNNFTYNKGNGLIATTTYSQKGLGVSAGIKRIQNMSFRSNRKGQFQEFNINYITPFTKQQAYSLATIYPYTSQPNGEMGSQIDVYYKMPKKTKLGGRYGTDISLNFSNSFDIHKTAIDSITNIDQRGSLGYNSSFFKIGENKLFQEINLEISRKINRNLKLIGTYINLINNDKVLVSQPILENQEHEIIHASIFILEALIKIPSKGSIKKSMRTEIQHLHTKQHFGNWAMGLIEYKISKWFFSFQDMYNYGHPEKPHYYSISSGYNKGANRFALTYGKQRKGLFCVGGVCREVPASNGFAISITSSF